MTKPKAISWYVEGGAGWFRLFGYGIYWRDSHKTRLSFSERYGYVKVFRIGRLAIRFLTP